MFYNLYFRGIIMLWYSHKKIGTRHQLLLTRVYYVMVYIKGILYLSLHRSGTSRPCAYLRGDLFCLLDIIKRTRTLELFHFLLMTMQIPVIDETIFQQCE